MKIPSITSVKNLKGRTVLVRADFNVPIKKSKILDVERITRTFSTIDYLLSNGAKVILISHLGRPKGKDKTLTLKPVYFFLKKKYAGIKFVSDCRGPLVKKVVNGLEEQSLVILENLRFYSGEEKNSDVFARELASLADLYVNDGFGVSHRAHASVHAILNHIPGYAGVNLIEEIQNISSVMKGFKRPATAILGGLKISTKIDVVRQFAKRFDRVLIGGALANNFLINNGFSVGASVYEKDFLKMSAEFLKLFKKRIILPVDAVISKSIDKSKDVKIIAINDMGKYPNHRIVDIGPKTQALFAQYIKDSKTVVWNGPMGIFEVTQFCEGTKKIGKVFAQVAAKKPYGLAGGGETVSALNQLGLSKKVDFISTGGGAMLEFIENGTLPALDKLIKMYAARSSGKSK